MGKNFSRSEHVSQQDNYNLWQRMNPFKSKRKQKDFNSIHEWLHTLRLSHYKHAFRKYHRIEDIWNFVEDDLKILGIQNSFDRIEMIDSLIKLKTIKQNTENTTIRLKERRNSEIINSSSLSCLLVDKSKQSRSLDNLDMNLCNKDLYKVSLNKELEWELNLDSKDIRSHAWYHGLISRQKAEQLVQQNGQFLVRDCVSSPGDYVLTCRSGIHVLHFIIKKTTIQPDTIYERVQYQFEDEAFDTVSDLITFYVGSGKCISEASMAKIQIPCNRLYSLGAHKTDFNFEIKKSMSPQLLNKNENDKVPKKPKRKISDQLNLINFYKSESDSGNGSDTSTQCSIVEDNFKCRGVILKTGTNEQLFDNRNHLIKSLFEFELENEIEDFLSKQSCQIKNLIEIHFDIDNFNTLLLPVTENKPLETSVLISVRNILTETSPKLLAIHLTEVDSELILTNYQIEDKCSNLDALLLPESHCLRLQLIERIECIRFFVAITILMCPNDLDRTEIISCWIKLAIETKIALGNLFGFCNIMLGLSMPQIQKLDSTWHLMRQRHTEVTFNFEAKLKPLLKNMNLGTNPQAPNTTIPHILPLILINENLNECNESNLQIETNNSLTSKCLLFWENNSSTFGLDTFFKHLHSTRKICESLNVYKRNWKLAKQDDCIETTDNLILDMFRTEFHLKFLWGTKGSHAKSNERYDKINQLLDILSNKYTNES